MKKKRSSARRQPARRRPAPDAPVESGSLEAVEQAYRVEVQAVDARHAAVRAARAAGSTWTELGAVLGISPQAVQKRYGAASTG